MILTSLLTRSLIGLTAFIAASNAMALDAQQIFERVSPSVVVIKAGALQGSGVVYMIFNSGLTPTTWVLTNCHVVKGYTQVTVERLGKSAIGNVLRCDGDRDMAIISVGGELPVAPRRTSALKVGEPVYAVGAPQGLELSISQGIVSQLRPTPLGSAPMVQTTAAISQGSSGGGLFDSEGRLIGLTTWYYKEGQSLNFAVPISFVGLLKHTPQNLPVVVIPEPTTNNPLSKQCGWTKLGARADGSFTHYIDYCKITGTGRYRFAWTMQDFKNPQKSPLENYYYQSLITRLAYDCQTSRRALTALYHYQSNMTQGAVLWSNSYPENEWAFKDAPPESVASFQIETVCK
jgi:hypothetical protein